MEVEKPENPMRINDTLKGNIASTDFSRERNVICLFGLPPKTELTVCCRVKS